MATKTANPSVYLHQADGRLWLQSGNQTPQPLEDSALATEIISTYPDAENFRILATRRNTPLIVALHELSLRQKSCPVQVASGLGASQSSTRLLTLTPELNRPPSVGGWHTLTETSVIPFKLALLLQDSIGTWEVLRALVSAHPVWHYLQPLPRSDDLSIFRLMAAILDPRFFISPDEPDSWSILDRFMGLSPGNIRHVVREKGPLRKRHLQNCRTLIDCWFLEEPTAASCRRPPYFVWRLYKSVEKPDQAFLQASRLYLRYLCGVWLHTLYPKSLCGDGLFVAEHFFITTVEQEWFKSLQTTS